VCVTAQAPHLFEGKLTGDSAAEFNFAGIGDGRSHVLLLCASLAFVAVAGACVMCARPGASLRIEKPPGFEIARWVTPPKTVVSENRIRLPEPLIASSPELLIYDRGAAEPKPADGPAVIAAVKDDARATAAPPSAAEPVTTVPKPIPRPREFGLQDNSTTASNAGREERGIFERLFGSSRSPEAALAYAAPETGEIENSRGLSNGPVGSYDKSTAIYDISARMLYMPNGTKFEAHSGLGELLDDPQHVNVRMKGATPPAVYELKPREKLFHGVQALRLNPIDKNDTLGRAGLLVHPFMLGPNGDSNGCVSVKDYDAFLQAYKNGEVKRLAVVASLK
jgi:hypothetical protein